MTTPAAPSFADQYTALTTAAGVAPLERTRIELSGGDRVKFLHNFCTNDIKRLTPGTGCELFITSVQGKILGHGHVLCEADRLVFDGVAGQADVLLPHLDKYLITEDVTLADRTADDAAMLVAGPQAENLLNEAGVLEVPGEANTHTTCAIAGVGVTVARLPYCGENTLLVTCPREQLGEVQAALVTAGGVPCESEAVKACRIEAGYPLFGQDMTEANLPQEIDRDEQTLNFTKGCYLGQETVARIDALGHVNKKLVAVKLSGESAPAVGDSLFTPADAEEPVGHITSAAFSPRLGAPLALAYLRSQHTAPGTQLTCGRQTAEVILL